jgi:hypothetical protein
MIPWTALIFSFLQLVARVYLVVECLINIAYLPQEVYDIPV